MVPPLAVRDEKLRKEEILRGRVAFRRVFQARESIRGELVRLHFRLSPTSAASQIRVGFAVASSFRLAVQRNRARRLMREAYRLMKGEVIAAFRALNMDGEVIFVYHGGGDNADPRRVKRQMIDEDMRQLFQTLIHGVKERKE
ncbi:MAG: ribonuclease P protein component [Bacteroidota bacterium]